MSDYLILTPAQADAVSKIVICEGQFFAPILLKDGTFYLDDHPDISEMVRLSCSKSTRQEFPSKIRPKQIDVELPDKLQQVSENELPKSS
jgi:hypothetical protein